MPDRTHYLIGVRDDGKISIWHHYRTDHDYRILGGPMLSAQDIEDYITQHEERCSVRSSRVTGEMVDRFIDKFPYLLGERSDWHRLVRISLEAALEEPE